MRFASLVLPLVLLVQTPSLAVAKTPAKPDFSSFAFMKGAWTCKVLTNAASPKSVGRTNAWSVAPDPSGYWYIGTESHGKRYLSRDAATSMWFSTEVSDNGFSQSDESPQGWTGNTITFHDKFNSDGSELDSTIITKLAGGAYTIADVNAKHAVLFEEKCTR